jgi:L-ascorbate metabolism protein UlaG (beta-lactamase superfamily)
MAFRFTVDGITLCFLGDLGHILSKDQIKAIGSVDILLVPVGGTYTLDADMAAQLIHLVKPKVAIPMHFRTKKCLFPITGVDVFLTRVKDVKKLGRSEIELSSGMLPGMGTQVWVLDYAC